LRLKFSSRYLLLVSIACVLAGAVLGGRAHFAFAVGPSVPGEAGAVTASTRDEFTSSLTNTGVTKIYLLNNISFDTNQSISGRSSMTIVGHGPEQTNTRYTLEQGDGTGYIANSGSGAFTLEFRDIVLYGRDHDGFVYNIGTPSTAETWRLRLVNADYSGPMLADVYRFVVELQDSNLICRTNSGGEEAEELAQAGAVEFRGKVDINFIGGGTDRDFVFWMHSTDALTRLRIAPNADVTIKNSHTSSGLIYYAGTANEFSVGAGARFVYTGQGPLTFYYLQYIKDVLIDTGAYFEFRQTSPTSELGPLLRVTNSFRVNAGATCIITRDGYADDGYIMRPNSGATVSFNNPRLVVLQCNMPSSELFRANSSTFTISGTVGVINVWRGTGSIARSAPEYLWQKEDLSAFSFSGAMGTATQSSASAPGLGANDFQSHAFSAANFDIGKARLLIMAAPGLTLDDVYEGLNNLTGAADASGDSVQALYGARAALGWPLPGSLTSLGKVSAGSGGEFNLAVGGTALDIGKEVTYLLQGSTTKAFYMGRRTIKKDDGVVSFSYVPTRLDFVTGDITSNIERILRADDDWRIEVEDTRRVGNHWDLYAKVTETLKTSSGKSLPGSLVFVDANEVDRPLIPGTAQLIFEGQRGQNATVSWAAERGLLLDVETAHVLANTPYSTTVDWTLQIAP
jgi:hypothetical protein